MNRNARRLLHKEVSWTQRMDPKDNRFVLIELRLPCAPAVMPTATYRGLEAFDRVSRFAVGYLEGHASELSVSEAATLMRELGNDENDPS